MQGLEVQVEDSPTAPLHGLPPRRRMILAACIGIAVCGVVIAAFFGGEAYGHRSSGAQETTTIAPLIPEQQQDMFERVVTPIATSGNIQFSRIDYSTGSQASLRTTGGSPDGFAIQADDAQLHYELLQGLPFGEVPGMVPSDKQMRITVRNATTGETGTLVSIFSTNSSSEFYVGYAGKSCIVSTWVSDSGAHAVISGDTGISPQGLQFVMSTTAHVLQETSALKSRATLSGIHPDLRVRYWCWILQCGGGLAAAVFSGSCGAAATSVAQCAVIVGTLATPLAAAGCVTVAGLSGVSCVGGLTAAGYACYSCADQQ